MKAIHFNPNVFTRNNGELKQLLRQEIKQFDGAQLPLQEGLSSSSIALDDGLDAMIISVIDHGETLAVKAGIFYAGIIAGCSCADDPTPTDIETEYCQMLFTIDKATGRASVELAD